MPRYVFEYHYRDGRVDLVDGGEYGGSAWFEVGAAVVMNDMRWRVRDVVSEAGYDAKVIFDDDGTVG